MASGSNPAPVMSLMYNQQKPYIAPKYMNSTEGGQLKFTGHFDIPMQFDPQYGAEQTITCSAHVPNKNFGKTKVAGLSLVVSIGKISIYGSKYLTLYAPLATKVVCFSCLLKCLRSLYGKQCGPRDQTAPIGSSLFWVHTVCFYT